MTVSLAADLELLADAMRVRLLALLETELSVGELAKILSTPQPTVSRHLKGLLQADWLVRRTVGTTAYLLRAPLDERRAALWQLVVGDPVLGNELEADQRVMARVLAERQSDPSTFFGRVAAGWDVLRDQLFGRRFLASTLAACLPPEATIVDLGCGTGEVLTHLAPWIAPPGALIGVDREPGMLAIARQRVAALTPAADDAAVSIVEGALEAVPLDDGIADLALLVLVLHHLPEPAAALSEARRLLRPSGRLVVVDMRPHQTTAWRTFGHLHQGFADDDLAALAAGADLEIRHLHHLAPDADAQGPPLFVATLCPRGPGTAPRPPRAPAPKAARKKDTEKTTARLRRRP